MAQEGASNEPVVETGQVDAGVVVPQKEDVGAGASEEVHIAPSKKQVVHKFIDEMKVIFLIVPGEVCYLGRSLL